jgi:3-oxoacyl-[acyl-carrier protein] reductase
MSKPSTLPSTRRSNPYENGTKAVTIETTINVIAPGPTETPTLVVPARAASPPKLPRLGRYIQPREIADLVALLLGPSGRSITGQLLVVCAGASL